MRVHCGKEERVRLRAKKEERLVESGNKVWRGSKGSVGGAKGEVEREGKWEGYRETWEKLRERRKERGRRVASNANLSVRLDLHQPRHLNLRLDANTEVKNPSGLAVLLRRLGGRVGSDLDGGVGGNERLVVAVFGGVLGGADRGGLVSRL